MKEGKQGRERPTNYIQICDTLADTYPLGVAHGVQKDAIQNSFDARAEKRKKVLIHFKLVNNDHGSFLTITDLHTTGLTGPTLYDTSDYEKDLPPEYHWARFEGFAYTKASPEAIGARGQGKFIFLRASRKYSIYYDTLRSDGIYRVGATEATRTRCPIYPSKYEEPWEGENGKKVIASDCGLEPLLQVGTRVIIVDPIDEIEEQIISGDFTRAIQETWFRALEKKALEITISYGNNSEQVSIPSPYPLPKSDSEKHKVWILKKDFKDNKIKLSSKELFRIKNFHAIYLNKGKVTESLRGIAIIHNGMKITSLDMSSAPPQVRKRVTGYIEFDKKLDYELRKGENQHPNHYDLKWRRKIPHLIKDYVNAQLVSFGHKKLGLRIHPSERKNRRRKNAEEWALQQIEKFANDLDLFGAKGGKRGKRKKSGTTHPKEIGVLIENFSFPDPAIAPRVNYGHTFKNLKVTTFNNTGEDRETILTFQAFREDFSVLKLIDGIVNEILSCDNQTYGPYHLRIDRSSFLQKGEYRLKATLDDAITGERIDDVTRRFWIEEDPPLRQPFRLEPVAGFLEPNQYRQWLASGSINNSPTIYYNTKHPLYEITEEETDDGRQADYLFQIALDGAIKFILDRPYKEDGSPDYHPLVSDNILGHSHSLEREDVPSHTYDEIVRYLAEVRFRAFSGE